MAKDLLGEKWWEKEETKNPKGMMAKIKERFENTNEDHNIIRTRMFTLTLKLCMYFHIENNKWDSFKFYIDNFYANEKDKRFRGCDIGRSLTPNSTEIFNYFMDVSQFPDRDLYLTFDTLINIRDSHKLTKDEKIEYF